MSRAGRRKRWRKGVVGIVQTFWKRGWIKLLLAVADSPGHVKCYHVEQKPRTWKIGDPLSRSVWEIYLLTLNPVHHWQCRGKFI